MNCLKVQKINSNGNDFTVNNWQKALAKGKEQKAKGKRTCNSIFTMICLLPFAFCLLLFALCLLLIALA